MSSHRVASCHFMLCTHAPHHHTPHTYPTPPPHPPQSDFFELVMLSPVIKGVVDNYDSALVRSMGMTPRKAVAHLYAPPPDAPTPAPPAAAYLEHLNLPVSKVVSGILEEFLAADEAVGAAVAAVAVLASAGFRGRARGSGFESEEGLDVLKALERMPAALRGRLGCGEGGGEGEGGDDGDGDGDGNTDGDGNAMARRSRNLRSVASTPFRSFLATPTPPVRWWTGWWRRGSSQCGRGCRSLYPPPCVAWGARMASPSCTRGWGTSGLRMWTGASCSEGWG